jgi:hypothetical protein
MILLLDPRAFASFVSMGLREDLHGQKNALGW